jgi:hypothetical protein
MLDFRKYGGAIKPTPDLCRECQAWPEMSLINYVGKSRHFELSP